MKSQTWLSDFTFTFHFHALEKEMATHSSVFAWRIPGAGVWWAAVYGVAQSRTRLKWLSSSRSCVWWVLLDPYEIPYSYLLDSLTLWTYKLGELQPPICIGTRVLLVNFAIPRMQCESTKVMTSSLLVYGRSLRMDIDWLGELLISLANGSPGVEAWLVLPVRRWTLHC